ncbi:hypothetical protein DFH07DRAFT_961018 [Mycena maculata]|uniref:Uncharacterized protein n=1 Tax=Mycena maculata TaxID=230809 RepID=A0AAD7IWJ5_9AGAR|nr:hypothetical protein DFH07DRAFT_961018 [Mycena maculata]
MNSGDGSANPFVHGRFSGKAMMTTMHPWTAADEGTILAAQHPRQAAARAEHAAEECAQAGEHNSGGWGGRFAQILAQKRRIPLAIKSNINGNVAVAPTKIFPPHAYPHLTGIPADYIRDYLSFSAMRSPLQAVGMSVPMSSLPKELEILMNNMVSTVCPTHMFAVYGDASASFGQKRRLTLFPAHDLIFRTHCTKLPTS